VFIAARLANMAREQAGIGALLKRPIPRLIWLGETVSVAGDRLYAVALIWLTVQLSHTPAVVAAMSLATTVPYLATSLVSGWLADRGDPLRLARRADLISALAVAVVPVLAAIGRLSIPALAAVAVTLSAAEAFVLPALQASLPGLVDRSALTALVSLLDSTDRLGRVLGPALIAVLAFLPQAQLFTVDAASFAVSAWCITLVIRRRAARAPQRRAAGTDSVLAGWRETVTRPVLRTAFLLRGACNLAWPVYTIATPFLIKDRFHGGLISYAALVAVFGAGNLIGTVLAARVTDTWLIRVSCLAWAGAGVALGLAALASSVALLFGASAAAGVCTPLANVTVTAHIARSVPQQLLARVFTAQRVVVVAAGAVGLPVAGVLVASLGAGHALALAGATICLAGCLALVRTRPGVCGKSRLTGTPA
jgi:MFS transporter, DHA3 family, macrolide efflux protein